MESSASRIGGVRNAGARSQPGADVFAFIDCDCLVPPDFLTAVAETFATSNASAVGCEVLSQSDGHWTERVWDKLHRPGGDGPRHYINSACFCIRREMFFSLNGFDESKVSSEDVDISRRLTEAGGTMWQSERLAVIHLGNAKSVPDLYRRLRWHGEGVWERGRGIQWSVTTTATFLHGIVVISSLTGGGWMLANHHPAGWLFIVLGFVIVPFLFVVARAIQHRRFVPILGGIGLMSITFPARLHGFFRSVAARA
jgi:hypothetical protein